MAESSHVDGKTFASFQKWRDDHTADDVKSLPDGTLRRYLAAKRNNLQNAIQMLIQSVEWQKTVLADPLCCEVCDTASHSHCFWSVGPCKDGSVGIYGNPPRASATAVEPTVKHVQHHLEHAYRTAEQQGLAQPGEAKWTWLVDFNGFGFSHAMQARLGISFATLFASHHPERLQRLILLNPPSVFSMLLTAIQPFADARTLSKVVTMRGDPAEIAAQLVQMGVFAQEAPALAWLQQTLGMPAVPGNLPSFPAEAEPYIPHGPGWKGWTHKMQ